jgi:hypothetical protein
MSVHAPNERLDVGKRQLLSSFNATLKHFRKLEAAGTPFFPASLDDILFQGADLRALTDLAVSMNASLGVFVAALLEIVDQNTSIARRPAAGIVRASRPGEIGDKSDSDAIDDALQRLKRIADTAEETLAERKKALQQMAGTERKISFAQAKNAELLRRLVAGAKKE